MGIRTSRPLATTTDQLDPLGWSDKTYVELGSDHLDHIDHSFYKLNKYISSDSTPNAATNLSNTSAVTRNCKKRMVRAVSMDKPLIPIPIFLRALVRTDHLIAGVQLHD